MIQVIAEVDGRPLSQWGCDGVLFATPTGSTGYAWSAGGPVVWPTVDAMLLVPVSAHALFARPMVVSSSTRLALELLPGSPPAVLWCDGQRLVPLEPGDRVEVVQGVQADSIGPFARIPVCRPACGQVPAPSAGVERARPPVIVELRIQDLGVIASATVSPGPGFTALTGETGRGQDDGPDCTRDAARRPRGFGDS